MTAVIYARYSSDNQCIDLKASLDIVSHFFI